MTVDDKTTTRSTEVMQAITGSRHWKEKREKLLDFGFEFDGTHMDASADVLLEEQTATPSNERQQRLVTYFESTESPSKTLVDDFLAEKTADEPNHPLFRRYFRAGSAQLRQLILLALDVFPTSIMLLNDLSFLSYFSMELSVYIRYYTRACVDVDDITLFSEIVRDFEHTAIEYDYDAYAALLQRDDISAAKKSVLNELLEEFNKGIED